MIKVKHPLDHCNISQEAFLKACPEKERRFNALQFTYGNIAYRYHQEAKEFNPTVQDFKHWLSGLPENMRQSMEEKGFEYCKTVYPFTRHVMEMNDIGLDEYVEQQMGAEDFAEYQRLLKEIIKSMSLDW
jgi:hypothetical protein